MSKCFSAQMWRRGLEKKVHIEAHWVMSTDAEGMWCGRKYREREREREREIREWPLLMRNTGLNWWWRSRTEIALSDPKPISGRDVWEVTSGLQISNPAQRVQNHYIKPGLAKQTTKDEILLPLRRLMSVVSVIYSCRAKCCCQHHYINHSYLDESLSIFPVNISMYSCITYSKFPASLLQSSVSHDPSDIILICYSRNM